jgi:phage gp45-like
MVTQSEYVKRGTLSDLATEGQGTTRLLVTFDQGDELEVEHYQPWGLASLPLKGSSEVIMLSERGNIERAFSPLVHDRRQNRPSLEPGEACLYSDQSSYLLTGPSGIRVNTPGPITIEGKSLEIRANGSELLSILIELVEKLSSSSKAGSVPVTNEQLPLILEKLQRLKG